MPRLSLLLLILTALVGCGYKAPLYLPDAKSESRKPRQSVVTPDPAPDRPVPAEAAPAPK